MNIHRDENSEASPVRFSPLDWLRLLDSVLTDNPQAAAEEFAELFEPIRSD